MKVEQYPVLEVIDELKDQLRSSSIVILQAPPGAGKSTVLPLTLLKETWLGGKKIIMLEPRRLAAKAVAERMAQLLDEDIGHTVGYRVRFDSRVSTKTRIEVVTEGILTRMIQSDNSLEEAALLIFDEFHERSLHADLALTLSLQIQSILRPDLKILIMSATLNAENLSKILSGAPVITSKGKQFPVSVKYLPQETDQPIAIKTFHAVKRAFTEEEGDILVFLPGAGEIVRLFQLLEDENLSNTIVHPLYGDLNFKKQQEAILPDKYGRRKIVLSTSIAETSLTIEGIRIVVDSGLSRVPRFEPRSGLTRLETIRVTKDSADQRMGRAGRLSAGVCYRLWTSGSHLSIVSQRTPEILEADLTPMMLELASWGVKDVNELLWITPPPPGSVKQSLDVLRTLDALDEKGITVRGKKMLSLPTHPRIAHMLLIAQEDDSKEELSLACDVAALLEERDPLPRETGVDLTLRVEALRKNRLKQFVNADKMALERIERLAHNWRKILRAEVSNEIPREGEVGKLVWAAYPERLAQQVGPYSNRYKMFNGRNVLLPQNDPLIREHWISVAVLDAGTNEGKVFLAATVDPADLQRFAVEKEVVRWDDAREMIVTLVEKRLGPLLLQSRPGRNNISQDERISVLLKKVREAGLRVVGDPDARCAIQARVMSLHKWRSDEQWPPMTDEYLLNHLEEWLSPFLTSLSRLSELQKLNVNEILRSTLPWELQSRFDVLAPEKIAVPSGSMIALKYFPTGEPPVLEVRLQEMFGLADTPAVNEGRNRVKLHLLSPGFKPVQVTQDLKSFWSTTYHEVRRELKIRYPRHHWPEDPWTAEAVRGAKRRNPSV